MINPSNALILSHMYQAYNVEKHKHIEADKYNFRLMQQNRFKCEHMLIDDVAMPQLRYIAMAYSPEFVASPVKDLGCHVMHSNIFKRFPDAALNMH